jgi:sigma-B regulation protein RsbU (phosphoserine phosphatase)
MTGTTAQPTVLVADDQADVVTALRLLLKDAGIATEPATSTRDVMARLAARPYDLLLMDLNYERDTTSGREGLELLSQVRARDSLLPVVVMTGWSSVEIAVEAMRRGARNYVCKPWSNADLVELVQREIEAGSALRHDQGHAVRETAQAQAVQRALLPEQLPVVASCDLAARWLPASTFGGDCYDVVALDPSHLALSIGDVCGKGLPAALLMTHLQASVRAFASPQSLPEAVVGSVNRALCRHGDLHRFVTLFYSVYDAGSRVLRFCNAGHNPPVLARGDGSIERLDTGGTVAGVFEEAVYEAGEVRLRPGDRLILFTDGVTEAGDPDGEEFGDNRLVAAVRATKAAGAAGTVDRVFGDVNAFCGAPHDDATVVVLRLSGGSQPHLQPRFA